MSYGMTWRMFGIFCVSIVLSMAWGTLTVYAHGGAGPGGPDNASMLKHHGCGHGKHLDKIKGALKLSEIQGKLMDIMHQARKDFVQETCKHGASGCWRKSRLSKRAFHLFRAELAAEHPDFYGAAAKLKSEYHGKYRAQFNSMVEATAAFMSSLDPAQRDKLLEMKARHGRGGPGRGRQKKVQRQ